MEFERKLKEIKEHFGELIDEDTAILLTQYSLGIKKSVNTDEKSRMAKISGIVVSKRSVFEKRYCKIDVKTDSGVTSVYFWDEAYEIAVNDIFPGMKIEVFCRRGESGHHVNSADFISFEVVDSELKTVSEIDKGQCVSVKGHIVGIEGAKLTKDGKKMAVFVISDGKSFAPLILWDDKVEYAEIIAPGDEVVVLNANVNEYGGKLNIHAGRNSFVDVRKLRI